MKKVVVIQVAALGREWLRERGVTTLCGLELHAAQSVMPAVTCTAQAAFRTASPVAVHGMVGNGFMLRDLARPLFWEQASALVDGERIWDRFRARGGRVAMLFWQQSLGEAVDMVLSPAPIHKHHGGMIQDCYSYPAELYPDLSRTLGRPFNLVHYWGPLASGRSSRWIAEATAQVLARDDAPHLCLTYLPVLDYDLQRFGPGHPRSRRAADELLQQLAVVTAAARARDYEVLIFGDYAIEPCTAPVFPNRALREAGLMQCRVVRNRHYPDLHASRAFAVVDHQVAHVYVRRDDDVDAVRRLLLGLEGVADVLDRTAQAAAGVAHARGGELLVVSAPGRWLAYPWWTRSQHAPDYAVHVDIHNKPGYDPAELFMGRLPWQTSLDAGRVRGSHGRPGRGLEIAWASSMLDSNPRTLLELATAFKEWLNDHE